MDLYMDKSRRNLAIAITAAMTLVVAIAVITIPAWRDHQRQAHVAEALLSADAAKLVVMEAATIGGGLANIRASTLPDMPPTATNGYVRSIHIADGGRVTVATQYTGATPDPVLVLIPANAADASSVISWTCTLAAGEASAVPSSCRAASPAPASTSSAAATSSTD
jgi:type IV pilus assembly protein PilA